jgi:hypothetical protein
MEMKTAYQQGGRLQAVVPRALSCHHDACVEEQRAQRARLRWVHVGASLTLGLVVTPVLALEIPSFLSQNALHTKMN